VNQGRDSAAPAIEAAAFHDNQFGVIFVDTIEKALNDGAFGFMRIAQRPDTEGVASRSAPRIAMTRCK